VLNEIGEQMKGSRRFDPGTDYSDVFADGVGSGYSGPLIPEILARSVFVGKTSKLR
jgi:hypothetical protein